MSVQVNFRQGEAPAVSRRSRKKVQTRRLIEDAALTLFAEQGFEATTVEQIAAQADVSNATFFRYFPSKSDVVLFQQDCHLPLLRQAILNRPASESDLHAVRAAMHEISVPDIDPERTLRAARAVASSPLLRGLYHDIDRQSFDAVAESLAKRRGKKNVDDLSRAAARIMIAVFGAAIDTWVAEGCKSELSSVFDREFALATKVFGAAGA
jgi:AcrR family transcriptional regulator